MSTRQTPNTHTDWKRGEEHTPQLFCIWHGLFLNRPAFSNPPPQWFKAYFSIQLHTKTAQKVIYYLKNSLWHSSKKLKKYKWCYWTLIINVSSNWFFKSDIYWRSGHNKRFRILWIIQIKFERKSTNLQKKLKLPCL